MVRDARRCRAPHHEGLADLILRRREAPSRRMKPPCWKWSDVPQLQQRLQKFAHGLARGFGGRGVAADMRVELDAGILVAERRLRVGIHQHAAFALPDMTMAYGVGIG